MIQFSTKKTNGEKKWDIFLENVQILGIGAKKNKNYGIADAKNEGKSQ